MHIIKIISIVNLLKVAYAIIYNKNLNNREFVKNKIQDSKIIEYIEERNLNESKTILYYPILT